MPDIHEFDPEDDVHPEQVFIIAHCSCGWRGNSFPSSQTSSYTDARTEWERHQEASRHSAT